jgi:hypothetical protein
MLSISVEKNTPKVSCQQSNSAPLYESNYLDIQLYATAKSASLIYLVSAILMIGSATSLCYNINEGNKLIALSLISMVMAIIAMAILKNKTLSRIASARVYMINPGDSLPLLMESFEDEEHHRLHIAVRLTDPNAISRLRSLDENLILNAADERELIKKALNIPNTPFYFGMAKVAERLRCSLEYGVDLWPIARLLIGKLLYEGEINYLESEEKEKPRRKRHLWFAFVTHRAFISTWFLMNSLVMLLMSSGLKTDEYQIPLVASIGPILWCLLSAQNHQSLMMRWQEWSNEWGQRPLGNLPLFILESKVASQWEEVHHYDSDFDAQIDKFGLDSATMFNVVTSVFLISSLTILQLIK